MKGLEDFQKEYMVFVKGGKYKKKVFNLEVCKYPVTQSIWINIMGYNPSRFKGANKPVEIVNWWEVLKFCNKLSEKYNLKPVYDLSQEEKGVLKIIHLGLYDCSGNVWEWCYDMPDDESIEDGIVYRTLKGGAWISNLELCQNFFCTSENAIFEDIDIGFRIVRTIH